METAGVVLGGIPIALYALDNYTRCLNAVKDVLRYEDTLKSFRLHVFIQQKQLAVTLQNIGLSLREGQLPTKVELESRLQCLYPDNCDEFMDILSRMELHLAKLLYKLDVDSQGKPKWTVYPPERAAWNWRRIKRGLGSSERAQVVQSLQYWNIALAKIIEQPEIPHDVDGPLSQKLQAQFNPKTCNAIRNNAHHIYDVLSQEWHCDCPEHRANLVLSWHMDKTTTAGPLRLAISTDDGAWKSLTAHIEQSQDTSTQVSQAPSSPTTTPRPSTSTPFPRGKKNVSFWSSKSRISAEHIDLLASRTCLSLTPPAAEVVSLCKFIRSQVQPTTWSAQVAGIEGSKAVSRLILCLIQPGTEFRRSVVLNEFLASDKWRQSRQQPLGAIRTLSRKERFAIASAATWAVLYLCGTPWLKDDWSGSETIELRVELGSNQAQAAWKDPSISCTLKSQHDTPSEDDHGRTAQIEKVRNRALFTLGVLLIELCLGTTLASLRQEYHDNSFARSVGVTPTDVDDYELANRQSDRVYLDAGQSFGYAVQRCLRCEFPGRDSQKTFDFEEFRSHFYRGVVVPVHTAYLLQCT